MISYVLVGRCGNAPVSGKSGVWSKADSHVYIDDYLVVSNSVAP